jgi:hypothetical protein
MLMPANFSSLEHALEQYRRAKLFERANEAYAALRANPELWGQEQAERQDWENTLMDGIDARE